jgi:hypothetical protein
MALCIGCAHTEPQPQSSPTVATTPATPVAPPIEASEDPPNAPRLLGDLRQGESLAYLVQLSGGDRQVRIRVEEVVVREGGAVAVKLAPVGVPLGESPVYVGWLIANQNGIFALEPHVGLSGAGFAPSDRHGRLVTEATGSIAWQVPAAWYGTGARAFASTDAAGWRLADAQPEVIGAVRGERCVAIERDEGDASISMRVCENVGVHALERHGEDGLERWRLLDLGDAPDELQP